MPRAAGSPGDPHGLRPAAVRAPGRAAPLDRGATSLVPGPSELRPTPLTRRPARPCFLLARPQSRCPPWVVCVAGAIEWPCCGVSWERCRPTEPHRECGASAYSVPRNGIVCGASRNASPGVVLPFRGRVKSPFGIDQGASVRDATHAPTRGRCNGIVADRSGLRRCLRGAGWLQLLIEKCICFGVLLLWLLSTTRLGERISFR